MRASKRISSRATCRRALLALAAALAAGWLLVPGRRAASPPPVHSPRGQASAPPEAGGPAGDVTPGRASVPPSYQDFLDTLAREFPFGRERQAVLREMLEGAPAEAVEALLRLSFGEETRNDLSHVLLERLAMLAPEAALAFGREKGFGVEPPWWHSVIGGLEDPRAVLGDVLALPASDMRTNFLGHVALRIGLADPDAAFVFALAEAPPEARASALGNAVFAAARRDPEKGFDAAVLFGAEAEAPELVKSVAVDWAMNDYPAARARIEAMPEGGAKQAALTGLAGVTIDRDLERAWGMIGRIDDAAAREALYLQAAKQLFVTDPARAERWLETAAPLGEASKAEARDFARRLGRR